MASKRAALLFALLLLGCGDRDQLRAALTGRATPSADARVSRDASPPDAPPDAGALGDGGPHDAGPDIHVRVPLCVLNQAPLGCLMK